MIRTCIFTAFAFCVVAFSSIDATAQQVGANAVSLDIKSLCIKGVPTFKIYNRGEKWPKMGTLKIFRVEQDGLKPVSERKMRFGKGQTGSFRLRTAGKEKMALFVEPSWYDRPFTSDAEIQCAE